MTNTKLNPLARLVDLANQPLIAKIEQGDRFERAMLQWLERRLTGGAPVQGDTSTIKVSNAATADAVPWAGVTNKPVTYPPDPHQHPGTDITSAVALANSVPWAGVTNTPATYPPSPHTHPGVDGLINKIITTNLTIPDDTQRWAYKESTIAAGVTVTVGKRSDFGVYDPIFALGDNAIISLDEMARLYFAY